MTDLRERVPGHSLVDELLRQWDRGTIRVDANSDQVMIDEEAIGWYRGVVGERRVAGLLDELGEGWTVLHSVPVGQGSSDIDHVVIGDVGVFTINTKYSPGKKVWVAGYGLYVDNHKQLYVRNSVNEAARASDLLSRACGITVPVTGLIVFVDPASMTHKAAAGGENGPEVQVIADRDLLRTLRSRPVLSPEHVSLIVAAAVRPETWHRAPAVSTIGKHIAKEFEALEEAVAPRLNDAIVRASTVASTGVAPAVSRRRAGATTPEARPAPTSTQRRATQATRTRPPGRSSSRTRSPRSRKASPLEKLVFGLVGPLTGIAMWVGIATYVSNR